MFDENNIAYAMMDVPEPQEDASNSDAYFMKFTQTLDDTFTVEYGGPNPETLHQCVGNFLHELTTGNLNKDILEALQDAPNGDMIIQMWMALFVAHQGEQEREGPCIRPSETLLG